MEVCVDVWKRRVQSSVRKRESSFITQVSFTIYIPSQGSQARPSVGQVEVQRKTAQGSDCANPEPHTSQPDPHGICRLFMYCYWDEICVLLWNEYKCGKVH